MPAKITINPDIMGDNRDALAVAYNEAYRVLMEQNDFEPQAEPTEEQVQFFADTAYANDPLQMKRTITARIATYDTSVPNPTPEQYQDVVDMLNMVIDSGAITNDEEESVVTSTLEDMEAKVTGGQGEQGMPPEGMPLDQLAPQEAMPPEGMEGMPPEMMGQESGGLEQLNPAMLQQLMGAGTQAATKAGDVSQPPIFPGFNVKHEKDMTEEEKQEFNRLYRKADTKDQAEAPEDDPDELFYDGPLLEASEGPGSPKRAAPDVPYRTKEIYEKERSDEEFLRSVHGAAADSQAREAYVTFGRLLGSDYGNALSEDEAMKVAREYFRNPPEDPIRPTLIKNIRKVAERDPKALSRFNYGLTLATDEEVGQYLNSIRNDAMEAWEAELLEKGEHPAKDWVFEEDPLGGFVKEYHKPLVRSFSEGKKSSYVTAWNNERARWRQHRPAMYAFSNQEAKDILSAIKSADDPALAELVEDYEQAGGSAQNILVRVALALDDDRSLIEALSGKETEGLEPPADDPPPSPWRDGAEDFRNTPAGRELTSDEYQAAAQLRFRQAVLEKLGLEEYEE